MKQPLLLSYAETPASQVSAAQLQLCAQLFGAHYGIWAANPFGIPPGRPVRMAPSKMRADFLCDDSCFVVEAKDGQELAGHAFVTRFDGPGKVRAQEREGPAWLPSVR